MIEFDKIKLIIWDMDDTFWSGTLSEGSITMIEKNRELVKKATDCGVVNSICSKNYKESVMDELSKESMVDLFVFTSIDWTPKGQRIARLISDMGLRPSNVLFLDDNTVNIQEAIFYTQDLVTGTPDILPKLYEYFENKIATDVNHKRLQQYKVLELKKKEQSNYSDNLEFLYNTNTKVDISYDCMPHIDRIAELLLRSNQLNYTKIRPTIEDLKSIIEDTQINTGYVNVRDRYGDYGIVGFFAVKDGVCQHFTFSCRAIGQGVEQYVYALLGYPILDVVEPVISYLDKSPAPAWINMDQSADKMTKEEMDVSHIGRILFKGPCDMTLISSYFERTDKLISEFTYVGTKGNSIEQHNHSEHIVQLISLTDSQKDEILEDAIFADSDMFKTIIFDKDINIVFLSTLPELNLGIYRNKQNGVKVVFGEWCYPLTDSKSQQLYLDGEIYAGGNKFTPEFFDSFSSKYEFIGRLTPEQSLKNIAKIFKSINPRATLVLILGAEIPYLNNTNKAYYNRENEHKELNDLLRKMACENDRIKLLDINKFISSQADFTNNINHFQKNVYYNLAQEVHQLLSDTLSVNIGAKKGYQLYVDYIANKLQRIVNHRTKFYQILKKIYHLIKK